jgi:hypothetical protein
MQLWLESLAYLEVDNFGLINNYFNVFILKKCNVSFSFGLIKIFKK